MDTVTRRGAKAVTRCKSRDTLAPQWAPAACGACCLRDGASLRDPDFAQFSFEAVVPPGPSEDDVLARDQDLVRDQDLAKEMAALV